MKIAKDLIFESTDEQDKLIISKLQLICNMKENRENLQTVNRGKNKLSKAKNENIRSESTHVYSRHRDSHA
uniref:Uncharacterized protein n=1 Tax=Trichogramma kaykai TaxID=54128 RepID=A0ABD2W4Y8_9HYME